MPRRGFTQTVFELDLPQSSADDIGTGLMLLRDIGGELTIPAGPMDTERGVVLSEERAADTPSYEAFKAQWRFQFKGQLVADRLPIGKVDIIKSASPELLRTLYRANYRPDRTTLIAVGDFDPAAHGGRDQGAVLRLDAGRARRPWRRTWARPCRAGRPRW